jgi:hypothetical protein
MTVERRISYVRLTPISVWGKGSSHVSCVAISARLRLPLLLDLKDGHLPDCLAVYEELAVGGQNKEQTQNAVRAWSTQWGETIKLGTILPYVGRIYNYESGDVEISWHKRSCLSGQTPRVRRFTVRGNSTERESNVERAVSRSRGKIRRTVMTAGMDHLLTLTYRENMCDIEKAWQDLDKFCRLVRERLGDFKYLAVPERQERGAVHWHLAVVGFQNVPLLRSLWRSVVGEGNIDVQFRHTMKRSVVARYISKYVVKSLSDSERLNKRSYSVSKGVLIAFSEVAFASLGELAAHLQEVSGRVVSYVWKHPEIEVGWMCTW